MRLGRINIGEVRDVECLDLLLALKACQRGRLLPRQQRARGAGEECAPCRCCPAPKCGEGRVHGAASEASSFAGGVVNVARSPGLVTMVLPSFPPGCTDGPATSTLSDVPGQEYPRSVEIGVLGPLRLQGARGRSSCVACANSCSSPTWWSREVASSACRR